MLKLRSHLTHQVLQNIHSLALTCLVSDVISDWPYLLVSVTYYKLWRQKSSQFYAQPKQLWKWSLKKFRLERVRAYDLCDASGVLFQLRCKANWSLARGHGFEFCSSLDVFTGPNCKAWHLNNFYHSLKIWSLVYSVTCIL